MEAIFDPIATYPIVFVGVIGALVVLAGLFFSRKIIKDKKMSRVAGFVAALTAVFIISAIAFGSYGPAIEFIAMKSNGKELALIETHQQGTDEDGGIPTTVNRMYVVDANTGNRILRQLSDYTELLCVTQKGVVIYGGSAAIVYDLHTGEQVKMWSKRGGFEEFPELTTGVNKFDRAVDFQNRPLDYISITANDGRKYYFDVEHEKLYPGSGPQGSNNPTEHFSFRKETGEIQQLIRHRGQQPQANFSGTFLKPEIIAQNDNERFVIIRHYTTLDESNAVFTAVSYDLKQLWQVEQQTIGLSGIDIVLYTDSRIYATYGGTVVCINASDGKQLWKAKL